jgi:nitrate reductase assembly molybdenum cofactor insertion protein NarJ
MAKVRDLISRIIEEHPQDTKEDTLKRFKAAIKTDPEARKAMAEEIFDDMMAFDPERAAAVIAAMEKGDPDASRMLRALLNDMRRH